jgi:GNAT superfamily N-acetyltransferase
LNEREKLNWEARYFSDSDLPKVGDFRRSFDTDPSVEFFRVSRTAEYYRWRLLDNPYGRGELSIAVDGDRIVGTAANTPKRMVVAQKDTRGAEVGETFTDPGFQRQGIFSHLVTMNLERAEQDGTELIYGLPNEIALLGWEGRLGFHQVRSAHIVNAIRPLRMRRSLQALLGNRALGLLGAPAAWTYFRTRFPLRRPSEDIALCESLPTEVPAFCQAALASFDVYLVRDQEYLSGGSRAVPMTTGST